MRKAVVVALAVAACVWVVVSAQQEVSPRPGPGSGITTVTGSVSIANTPSVRATQGGDWRVDISNTPGVRVVDLPSPGFVRVGGRYHVTWSDGTGELITVVGVAPNGWIETERGRRWINVASARAIQSQ